MPIRKKPGNLSYAPRIYMNASRARKNLTRFHLNFIYSPSHHWTSTAQGLFLKWIRTQGRSPHASGKIPKYLQSRRHSPNGGPPGRLETKQQTIGKTIINSPSTLPQWGWLQLQETKQQTIGKTIINSPSAFPQWGGSSRQETKQQTIGKTIINSTKRIIKIFLTKEGLDQTTFCRLKNRYEE